MIRQKYNCRPINKQTITQIRNSHNATALLNRFGGNAMFIGIRKNCVIRNSLEPLKDGEYTNFIKWTKDARAPGAQMVLFNGNHRWTYMQELYEQEFHDYEKALKEFKTVQRGPERQQAETVMTEKKNLLDQNSIWLARFFDLDALEAAGNSSLLLHELTMNQALPSKDDTDTDKLKNVLRLGRGEGSEMAEELIADAIERWEKYKSSTNTRTAWAVSNKPLFNFLRDIYAHPCFESSPLINISLLYSNWNPYMTGFFITTFRPMLAMLEFL
ncbi:hypothetical protein CY34DRAFT_100512, partial [Suillus luteus UH-Slu-Lm8-n1]